VDSRHEDTQGPPGRASEPELPGAKGWRSPASAPAPEAGLLERELELATIQAFVDRVRAGRGGRLVLDGPPGIGKSALLAAMCERATTQGFRVLWAEASEVASQVAFGFAASLLGEFWPGDAQPAPPGSENATRAPAELVSLERAVGVVLDLAERAPVLLAVDDVQWVDPASLRWLALLARHLARSRVALALAVRAGHDPAGDVLGELLDDRRAVIVRPGALSPEGAARLVSTRVRVELEGIVAAACHGDSGGNPYLLGALGDALRQSGVPSGADAPRVVREIGARALRRGITARMDRLDAEARALAQAAAAVGDVGGVSDLAIVAGIDRAAGVDAAHRLVDAGLLRSVERCEPSHPLIGEAIRGVMGTALREQFGRVAAARLLATGRVEAAAARLVDLPPRGSADVVDALGQAAQAATARGAPDVAATLLRRALEEPPSGEQTIELRAMLGHALLAQGEPEAIGVLGQALEDCIPGPSSGRLAASLAIALCYQRRSRDAIDVLDAAAERVRSDDPGLAEELEAQALQNTGFDPALRPERLQRLRASGDRRGSSTLAHRMRLAELASESLGACRPARQTVALAERALAGGVLLSGSPASHATAVLCLAYAGETARARSHIQDAIAASRSVGATAMLGPQLGFLGEVHRLEGDMIATEHDLRTGLDLVPDGEIGPPFMLTGVLESLVEQDEIPAAEDELRRAGMTGTLPDLISSAGQLYARGRVRIAAGRTSQGLDDLRSAGELLSRFEMREPQVVPWRIYAAQALRDLGEHEDACLLAAEQLELAREFDAPHALGPALRLHALTLDRTSAVAILTEAAELLEGSFARLELARVLIDLGAATRAAGEQLERSRALLERGARLAEQLGGVALARRAGDELLASGARPRREHRRGARGLTPAERRAARLAAEGLSNRELAETLIVSQKTIETHMASAFRKLGIKSRNELPGALSHDGPAAPVA
jgi:DNA-binding CsgD family transcriptional regulator